MSKIDSPVMKSRAAIDRTASNGRRPDTGASGAIRATLICGLESRVAQFSFSTAGSVWGWNEARQFRRGRPPFRKHFSAESTRGQARRRFLALRSR